jgi:restriction endonuclease
MIGTESRREYAFRYRFVLIEVIDFARRLLRWLAANPGLLRAIDDRKFEELVATLLSDLGLQDVELTPPQKDGGKDIIATHIGADGCGSRYLIECKHWVSGNKVTRRWAIHLLSVARTDHADGAVLLSTSGFGPKLIEQEASLMKDDSFSGARTIWRGGRACGNVSNGAMLVQPVDPRELLELGT